MKFSYILFLVVGLLTNYAHTPSTSVQGIDENLILSHIVDLEKDSLAFYWRAYLPARNWIQLDGSFGVMIAQFVQAN